MLWGSRFGVVELLEGFCHIIQHGEVHLPFGLVPIECDANVPFTCPISGDRVVLLEDSKEVICMFVAGVLDSKIVDHKGKLDEAPFVAPEAGYKLALEVPVCIEVFFK